MDTDPPQRSLRVSGVQYISIQVSAFSDSPFVRMTPPLASFPKNILSLLSAPPQGLSGTRRVREMLWGIGL